MLHIKFGFGWPSGFREEDDGSGELKTYSKAMNSLLYVAAKLIPLPINLLQNSREVRSLIATGPRFWP